MHSHEKAEVVNSQYGNSILILVVMEDALAHSGTPILEMYGRILILVVMEDALAPFNIL